MHSSQDFPFSVAQKHLSINSQCLPERQHILNVCDMTKQDFSSFVFMYAVMNVCLSVVNEIHPSLPS